MTAGSFANPHPLTMWCKSCLSEFPIEDGPDCEVCSSTRTSILIRKPSEIPAALRMRLQQLPTPTRETVSAS